MAYSLRGRLLYSATAVLFVFLGLTGAVLDQAFSSSAERGQAEKMLLQIFGLISVAEESDGGLFLPDRLQEPRFNQLGTGLFGLVSATDGSELWRSPSGLDLRFAPSPELLAVVTGEQRFGRLVTAEEGDLFYLSYGVRWESSEAGASDYIFTVMETTGGYEREIQSFRNNLWGWLGAVVVILLIVQAVVMRWGLEPLKQLASDLRSIEEGRSDYLSGSYPSEIEGVTRNLNLLIRSEREQMERYRTTLADLAHSLKTPLAIVKGAMSTWQTTGRSSTRDRETIATLEEQVTRMDQLVSYQLQRAVATSSNLLRRPVPIEPVVSKLVKAMGKVYVDKALDFEVDVGSCAFLGDERDLMEVLGNVLDNACKYGHSSVAVRAQLVPVDGDRDEGGRPAIDHQLELVVEDDGNGIEQTARALVLSRGARLDTQESGQGIGLAVVNDIVQRYDGSLELAESASGGARVVLRFT